MTNKRESLYDISWKVDEPAYRKGKGLSYSTLSRYNRDGFDGLPKLFDKVESPSLLFGSIVDTILTGSQEEFDENYMVADFPEIVDSQLNVIKYLFDKHKDKYQYLSEIPTNDVIMATELLEFQKNWKPETRAKVIKEKGEEYYGLLYLSEGKTIVSTQMYRDAQECVTELRNNENTQEYFSEVNPFDESIEKFYQLKFKGEYEGIQIRCMLDQMIVDHTNKVIHPIDLKTSYSSEWNFPSSFVKWGYWIQAQLYWYIVRQNLDKHELYKDYKLLDFKFIVISNGTRTPLVWEYPDTQATEDIKIKDLTLRNWRGLVKELNYYLDKQPRTPIGIKKINNINEWL